MALTNEEKTSLRGFICEQGMRITPELLAGIAAKTDEEVRALLASDKIAKLAALEARKSDIEASIAELK